MSVLDFLKPAWKRKDPAVRLAAVATLGDQSTLARIATEDASEDVRVAATRRLGEKEVLAWLASSAESARVREAAVELLTDLPTLRRAAACDESAWVRVRARLRAKLMPNLRDRITAALERLAVTPAPAGAPAFGGTAEQVSAALLTDARFCLNGQLDDETGGPANAVEFLAAARAPDGAPLDETAQPVSYAVRVVRCGAEVFNVYLNQHRFELASNAAALGWQPGPGRDGKGEAGVKPPSA